MQNSLSEFRLRFQVFLVCRSRNLSPVNGPCPKPYFVGEVIPDTAYGGNGRGPKTSHITNTERTQPLHTEYICRLLFGPLQHTKEVARIIRISDHIEVIKEGCAFDFAVDVAKRREIFDRKADAIEKRDFVEG